MHDIDRRNERLSPELSVVSARAGDDAFDLTQYTVGGWQLFVVRGDITGDGYRLVTEIVESGAASGADKIIVDLARVSAITPSCVQELARIDRQLRGAKGDFRLVVDGVAVLQAIRQAGLSGRFEIHRFVGDIVGAVPGIDERGRGKRRGLVSPIVAHPASRRA
jgi:anti-anti-sigma regulatory factor